MSTRLELRVHQVMMGDQALSGAIADIIPISGDQSGQAYRGVVIPVSGTDTQQIDVAPGRYLVRAYLPSGTLLTEQVDALPDKTTPAVLVAEQTPHEWLGWQKLVQQQTPRVESGGIVEPVTAGPAFIDVPPGGAASASWNSLRDLLRRRSGVSTGDVIHALHGVAAPPFGVQNFHDDSTTLYAVQATNGAPLDRLRYAVIQRSSAVEVVALPLPWHRLDRSYQQREASFDIAIPRSAQQRVSVAVHDEELGSLLGFVATGRLPFATVLGNEGSAAHRQMLDALYKKVDNPFAAAVGAYLLLKADPTPSEEWHSWLRNLADLFPWLPDGKVLLGALRLRFAQTDADVAAAREAFEEGWQRGIPVLAPVLRVLLDGMSTLVGDPDAEASALEPLLPSVRAVAGAMAIDQAFTTLRLGDRSS